MEFSNFVPRSTHRVHDRTSAKVNRDIEEQMRADVTRVARLGPHAIDNRIMELEREWDIERAVETGASLQVLLGLMLGAFVNKRFFAWSGFVACFLLLHSIQGWCPPVPMLRRLGFRTPAEIEDEINALRLIRGDLRPTDNIDEAIARARLN
jgi:hypothetical protein